MNVILIISSGSHSVLRKLKTQVKGKKNNKITGYPSRASLEPSRKDFLPFPKQRLDFFSLFLENEKNTTVKIYGVVSEKLGNLIPHVSQMV